MKEQLISFETAKLAKEKGFDMPCLFYYDGSEMVATQSTNAFDLKNYNLHKGSTFNSAPSQSLLQKWLREKCGYFLTVIFEVDKYYFHGYDIIHPNVDLDELCEREIGGQHIYNTYEEALEFGLQKALELIK